MKGVQDGPDIVAPQNKFGKPSLLAVIILRLYVPIAQIATSVAGGEDFLPRVASFSNSKMRKAGGKLNAAIRPDAPPPTMMTSNAESTSFIAQPSSRSNAIQRPNLLNGSGMTGKRRVTAEVIV